MERFAAFAADHQRGVEEFVAIKSETAKAFMAAEEARGVSPKTWNDALKLLRATFKHLHPHLTDGMEPVSRLGDQSSQTVELGTGTKTVQEYKRLLRTQAKECVGSRLEGEGDCVCGDRPGETGTWDPIR